MDRKWAESLYEKVDGKGLNESARVPQQHMWIREGTRFLSGKDFVQSCKLRINTLPCKSRTTRGRSLERFCRAGCNRVETLNHILQQCHRIYGYRIRRHDVAVSYLSRALETKGYVVSAEPRIETEVGTHKPDLVAEREDSAIALDGQIVNDQIDLDAAHRRKTEYYANLAETIKTKYSVRNVRFSSVTFSWRGVWSQKSA